MNLNSDIETMRKSVTAVNSMEQIQAKHTVQLIRPKYTTAMCTNMSTIKNDQHLIKPSTQTMMKYDSLKNDNQLKPNLRFPSVYSSFNI
jgi:hypothetical protein